MRIARLIIGVALIVIGIIAIAGGDADGTAWWLIAALIGTLGLAGIAMALRPADASAV